MATTINIRDLITAEAQRQGVDPALALAVATRETRMTQWLPNGSVIRGADGELGVFQLMPGTAAALGVDPTDVYENIEGGIRYLRQMYGIFGSWELALQAYNWGAGNLRDALAGKRSVPSIVKDYSTYVLSVAAVNARAINSRPNPDPPIVAAADPPASSQTPGSATANSNSRRWISIATFSVLGLAVFLAAE